MQIRTIRYCGRKGWELDNDVLKLVMLQGGGHIASLTRKDLPAVNPLWKPVWKGIEPWHYTRRDASRFSSKLLASICGHNLCLGWFGDASPAEEAAGLGCHGEAPIVRWNLVSKSVTKRAVTLVCECVMPSSLMRFRRTIRLARGSSRIRVRETVFNLARRDLPFTMCEHVTLGPPFLEKGVTLFDMSATKGHTFPGPFGKPQRLKMDTVFTWPKGPGANGKPVDMRRIGRDHARSSDFSTQLMDPAQDKAWFSAVNPRLGVLIAYRWKREDFPWIGNWEENFARTMNPWQRRSLTRGMEFANTPFPDGLRKALERKEFNGLPTYRWLPARGRVTVDYDILMHRVDAACAGVSSIQDEGEDVKFVFRSPAK